MLFALLLVSRPLGGALAGAVPGAAQAYLADSSSEEERTGALALVGIASGLGSILGPALGGALAAFGLTAPLWAAAALALVAAGLVARRLREPERRDGANRGQALSWRDPRPRSMLLLIAALFTGIALLSTTMGFLFQDRLSLDDQTASSVTGGVLAAVGVGLVAVQVLIVQRRKPKAAALLRGGLPLMAAGVVLLLVSAHIALFVASGLVMGAGAGLAFSGAIASASLRVGAGDQGTLGGLTVAAQVLGFIVGPVLGGLLYQWSELGPGVAALALVGVAFVVTVSDRPAEAAREVA
jgi:predicted MFS family arabinose efflux permease